MELQRADVLPLWDDLRFVMSAECRIALVVPCLYSLTNLVLAILKCDLTQGACT
jgi:hypothetical protein